MEQMQKKQIQKKLTKKNAEKVHDLGELFKRTEALLHEIEMEDSNITIDEELIASLMDVIYRSAINSFVTSVYNSFFKYNSMPLEIYHIVGPLLERWRSILGVGDNLNKQTLIDFVAELDEFSKNQPEFVFDCGNDNDTWTISRFFEEGIWVLYFKGAEDKAIALCDAMRKILESREDKNEFGINSRPQNKAKAWIENNVLILDTETTGLGATDQIVDIAIIDCTGKILLNTLIKPTCRISAAAKAIHGITDEMVSGSPSWADIHDQFCKIVNNRKVIIYNSEYDSRILLQTMAEHGLSFYASTIMECVMVAYAEYWGEYDNYRKSYRWHKLSDAAEQQGVEVTDAHRALGDCKTTLGIIQLMARDGE